MKSEPQKTGATKFLFHFSYSLLKYNNETVIKKEDKGYRANLRLN